MGECFKVNYIELEENGEDRLLNLLLHFSEICKLRLSFDIKMHPTLLIGNNMKPPHYQ